MFAFQYPDVVFLAKELLGDDKGSSFVLDAEIVAIDPIDGTLKTFQELSNRARKDVSLEDVKVFVCVFGFDVMFLNGMVSAPQ